jgi:hypothetical protein
MGGEIGDMHCEETVAGAHRTQQQQQQQRQ